MFGIVSFYVNHKSIPDRIYARYTAVAKSFKIGANVSDENERENMLRITKNRSNAER